MTVGENIRKRRLELKMSQQEVADALGMKSRSSIAKIEKNINRLPQDKIVSLANILNTSVEYILTGELPVEEKAAGNIKERNEIYEYRNQSVDHQNRKCIAIVLAGGQNRRNKYNVPFQFVTVKEKPVLMYTLENYQKHPLIDEIYVVSLEGWNEFINAYAERSDITKLKDIVPAGNSGCESIRNAIEWISKDSSPFDIIVIQEATRPFSDPEIISNAIRCCIQYGSAVTFEKLDVLTPFYINPNSKLQHLDATKLINVQSPEVYSYGLLRYAFTKAEKANHVLDETICAVFLDRLNIDLNFCEGHRNNYRIVSEDDLQLFR